MHLRWVLLVFDLAGAGVRLVWVRENLQAWQLKGPWVRRGVAWWQSGSRPVLRAMRVAAEYVRRVGLDLLWPGVLALDAIRSRTGADGLTFGAPSAHNRRARCAFARSPYKAKCAGGRGSWEVGAGREQKGKRGVVSGGGGKRGAGREVGRQAGERKGLKLTRKNTGTKVRQTLVTREENEETD
ncbi:hypothetical protein NDU88_005420 [Pleurodeles waltl]|uniref:Secreted protein n=1 Tax=Pleurodeles waltl TaxID=8319 RepID=A0AAV7NQJ3_PLEWA|nr:hypothetical protein NDU88_005420 [Pleurodeles waltl]